MVHLTTDGAAVLKEVTPLPADYAFLPADPAYDMWSLGCVLYELCTGGTLFVCSNSGDLIHQKDLIKLHHWADDEKQIRLGVIKVCLWPAWKCVVCGGSLTSRHTNPISRPFRCVWRAWMPLSGLIQAPQPSPPEPSLLSPLPSPL